MFFVFIYPELDEFLLELDEDTEGMQGTILFLQNQLRNSKTQVLFRSQYPFMPTVPTFAVRETYVSRHNGGTSPLWHNGGTPLCRET